MSVVVGELRLVHADRLARFVSFPKKDAFLI